MINKIIYILVSVPCVLVVMFMVPFIVMGDLAWVLAKPTMDFVDAIKERC